MINITAGKLKGKKIKSVAGLNTRPTSSKVREALFNVLNDKIIDSSWLDLFGGTGSIGFEALSRGAKKVTFTEKDYSAYNCLKDNIKLLNIESNTLLFRKDALLFLKNSQEKYDFVYLDPPYQSSFYESVFSIFNEKVLIEQSGILIVEHRTKDILPEIKLNKIKSYKYGDTTLTFFGNE